MARIVSSIIITAALLAVCACGSQAASQPSKPPPAPDPRSEATPEKRNQEAPKLIAPPPAYGNKVVMAKGRAPTSSN